MICQELDIVTLPMLSVISVLEASILNASDSPQGAASGALLAESPGALEGLSRWDLRTHI